MKRYSGRQIRKILRKYSIRERELIVAEDLKLKIIEVEDAYALLDQLIEREGRLHRVERFPYWAELWPAALALSRWLWEKRPFPPPERTVELGCGLGVVGITLARMGWKVEATDFVEDALVFASHNARLNQADARHSVGYLDWSNPVGRPCECLVGSDLVYEKKNHPYLARLLRRLLVPGGIFYLSDPRRPAASHFVEMLERQGYGHEKECVVQPWKSLEHQVDVHIFSRSRTDATPSAGGCPGEGRMPQRPGSLRAVGR